MLRLVQVALILGVLEGIVSQKIEVSQIPEVHGTAGSEVTLPCTYNVSGVEEGSLGSYKWYRHLVKTGPEVSDSNKDFTGRISRADAAEFTSKRDARITLHNVEPSDTGTYYCQVTFQHGKRISGHGDGTTLNVTLTEGKSSSGTDLYISVGAVVGFIAVILLVFGYYSFYRQAPRSSVEAGPVIYTEFPALDTRLRGHRGPGALQEVETSHYMMENQQYDQFLPVQAPQGPGPCAFQEMDLYSIIP
ncbi:sodium channel regulatory subunit beta-2-like [Rhinoderma darwinii]|uniref:sodium channel regulatory subunit beta-2-like n=1 Tax=Rhinoderma darwinii TaxID=43563 RepID=UPI003F673845